MTWKSIKDIAWFSFIFILAITLIEYEPEDFWVDFAGDLFGALAISFISVEKALRDE